MSAFLQFIKNFESNMYRFARNAPRFPGPLPAVNEVDGVPRGREWWGRDGVGTGRPDAGRRRSIHGEGIKQNIERERERASGALLHPSLVALSTQGSPALPHCCFIEGAGPLAAASSPAGAGRPPVAAFPVWEGRLREAAFPAKAFLASSRGRRGRRPSGRRTSEV